MSLLTNGMYLQQQGGGQQMFGSMGPPQQMQQNPQQQQSQGGGQGGAPGGPGSQGNGQNPSDAGTAPQPDYTLGGVLHFLQTEWRRHERDRNEWEIERAEMRVSTWHSVEASSPPFSLFNLCR